MLLNDAYMPHSFDEIQLLVTPEVVANLDPKKSYGIWWWGKERHRTRQTSERKPSGKVYRKVTRSVPLPKEEWVAVPVPDAGVPKAWVDAARDALKKNERPSFNSARFWELSGGIVRCGCCGWAMATTTVSSNGLYYRCRKRSMYGKDICGMNKYLRADLVEPLSGRASQRYSGSLRGLGAAFRKCSRGSTKPRRLITKRNSAYGGRSSPRSGVRGPTSRSSPPRAS
jgi:Recombinase zinc beta ribbon domain